MLDAREDRSAFARRSFEWMKESSSSKLEAVSGKRCERGASVKASVSGRRVAKGEVGN